MTSIASYHTFVLVYRVRVIELSASITCACALRKICTTYECTYTSSTLSQHSSCKTKTSWVIQARNSQSVSCSVGIMSSCSLLAFLLTVSLTSSHLHCLCSPVSPTRNCARLLIVATPVLKALIKSTKVKSHGNNACIVIIVHVLSADVQTNKQMQKT